LITKIGTYSKSSASSNHFFRLTDSVKVVHRWLLVYDSSNFSLFVRQYKIDDSRSSRTNQSRSDRVRVK
jgi:hypothetical protein